VKAKSLQRVIGLSLVASMVAGCGTTVSVVKSMDLSSTDLKLPVSTLCLPSGKVFSEGCAMEKEAGPPALIEYGLFLGALYHFLEQNGFSTVPDSAELYLSACVVEASASYWTVTDAYGNLISRSVVGLRSITCEVSYADGKGRLLAVIRTEFAGGGFEQAAEDVARFTKATFGKK